MRGILLAAGTVLAVVVAAHFYESHNAPTRVRVLKMSDLLGHVEGEPQTQKIDGLCTPIEGGTEMKCDIYNGLESWSLTEVTVAVITDVGNRSGSPDGSPARWLRSPVSIPSLSTRTIDLKLGAKIDPDYVGNDGTHVHHWEVVIGGAKGVRADKGN